MDTTTTYMYVCIYFQAPFNEFSNIQHKHTPERIERVSFLIVRRISCPSCFKQFAVHAQLHALIRIKFQGWCVSFDCSLWECLANQTRFDRRSSQRPSIASYKINQALIVVSRSLVCTLRKCAIRCLGRGRCDVIERHEQVRAWSRSWRQFSNSSSSTISVAMLRSNFRVTKDSLKFFARSKNVECFRF